MKTLKSTLIGLLAGFITGLFSTGGGMIILPSILYLFKIDEKEARATTIFSILPLVVVSSIFYYKDKYFDISLGIKCAIGGIIGGIIGSLLLKKLSNKFLKIIFIIFILYASINMLIKV